MPPQPLNLRLLNDYDVVVAGLRSMLAPFSDRVRIIEEDVARVSGIRSDVTLWDTFGGANADVREIDEVVADSCTGYVVVYTWNLQPGLVRTALDKGCRGYLDKALPAEELVAALEAVAAGRIVALREESGLEHPGTSAEKDWPGKQEGLSEREAEVIALITQGFTNPDIAARVFISLNSLKTYIRSAYRKMGVERRAQAVRWGIEHGMLPPGVEHAEGAMSAGGRSY